LLWGEALEEKGFLIRKTRDEREENKAKLAQY
jgi:hypothetical protein